MKFTTTQRIGIAAIAVTFFVEVGGWFFVSNKKIITTPNSPCSINTMDQNGGTNNINCSNEEEREVFYHQDVKDKFKSEDLGSSISLPLKFKPKQGSVNISWGPENISPRDFNINGNVLTIYFRSFTATQMQGGSDIPIMVNYFRDQ